MNFVLQVSEPDAQRVITFYRDYQEKPPNEHVRFFAKTKVVTVSLYHTNKVMFQGEDAEAEHHMWEVMLGHETKNAPAPKREMPQFKDYYYPSIGSDEVGKGDVFGPVIVAAAYLSLDDIEWVKGLGIKDSKQLQDERIRIVGKELINRVPYSVLTLHNEKYNELIRQGYNLNKMVAYLHNRAIINVFKKVKGTPDVFQDQFAEERLYYRYLAEEQDVYRKVTFLTKAESKYASVAIASIIARYAFLRQFDQLSRDTGFELKKGAGALVDVQLSQILAKKGPGFLESFTKLNFKNVKRVIETYEDEIVKPID